MRGRHGHPTLVALITQIATLEARLSWADLPVSSAGRALELIQSLRPSSRLPVQQWLPNAGAVAAPAGPANRPVRCRQNRPLLQPASAPGAASRGGPGTIVRHAVLRGGIARAGLCAVSGLRLPALECQNLEFGDDEHQDHGRTTVPGDCRRASSSISSVGALTVTPGRRWSR